MSHQIIEWLRKLRMDRRNGVLMDIIGNAGLETSGDWQGSWARSSLFLEEE
jgi:hypothetical protein